MDKICLTCGRKVDASLLCCPTCGKPLPAAGPPAQPAEIGPSRREQQRQRALNWDRKTCLSAANLADEDLSGSRLERANLCDSNLQGANLSGACLQGANLAGAWLQGATLAETSLQNANLCRASLACASLRGADLRGARLVDATLDEADLWEATLAGADLYRASLWGANLLRATLDGTFLMEANFAMARVTPEQFHRAWAMCGATMPDGTRYDGRYDLPGDVNLARCAGYAPHNPDEMTRFYSGGA